MFINAQKEAKINNLMKGSGKKGVKKYEEEKEDQKKLDFKQVEREIEEFVSEILPNAVLIREFNGNFVY